MYERIKITDFSIIKNVDFDIKKFNLIIGEQASGKSLIAKIIYFFKELIYQEFIQSLIKNEELNALKNKIEQVFRNLFPEYFWENQNFEIIFNYKIDKTYIKITKDKSSKIPQIQILFSERIERKYNEIKNKVIGTFIQTQIQQIHSETTKTFNSEFTLFTPAGRSFFSLVKENIFTLSLMGVANDFFVTQFGSYYEKFKKNKLEENIKPFADKILKGEFYFDNKQNEIVLYGKQKSKLKDSSTGQQELIPIFMLLNSIIKEKDLSHFLIIEEPGAHLFPKTQKDLVDFFSYIANITNNKTGFFLTTHSPYILAAVSNLIQAYNTANLKPSLKGKISEIVDENFWLNIEDVSLFYIENGEIKELIDKDLNNIDAQIIDNVSEEISDVFDNLLNIKYND